MSSSKVDETNNAKGLIVRARVIDGRIKTKNSASDSIR